MKDKEKTKAQLIKDLEKLRKQVLGHEKDITERKKAEEKARFDLEKLNQILNTVVDGMRVIDKDFNIIHVNDAFSNLVGMCADEMLGKKCYEVFPGTTCNTPDCTLTRIIADGRRMEIEEEKDFKDGTRVPFIVVANPYRGPNGELIGVIVDYKDISKRKNAEKKIRDLAKFPEENINPVYRVSKDGVLLYANSASRRLILQDQTEIGDKIPENWIEIIRKVYDSGKKQEVELEFSGRVYLFVQIPVVEEGYVNSYGIDITERKKAEALIMKQQEALEAKNIALKEVLEQISVEKDGIKKELSANIEKLIKPQLVNLKKNLRKKNVEQLEKSFQEIADSFGLKISSEQKKLTPREIQICDIIRKGCKNKEIARMLKISVGTVEINRKNIRRKLNISGKNINLQSYLQNL